MYLMTTPPPIPEPHDFPSGPPLVLDLGSVATLSAAGIGELVGLRSRLLASGGRLVLVNVSGHARRALEESRLADVMGVCRGPMPAGDEGEVAEGGVWEACGKA
jgi:STAS domain